LKERKKKVENVWEGKNRPRDRRGWEKHGKEYQRAKRGHEGNTEFTGKRCPATSGKNGKRGVHGS